MKPSHAATLPRIVLASSSPRRIELLTRLQLKPLVISPDVDERVKKGENPAAVVRRLSRAKAAAIVEGLDEDIERALVVAADTIVVSPSGKQILGKPEDPAHARRMLSQLSGARHSVLTGYTIHPHGFRRPSRPLTRVVRSSVWIRKLSPQAILAYIATGEPLDKAGSYAAQGVGMTFIEKISGSYTNVVGLPMAQLIRDLEEEFGFPVYAKLSANEVERAAAKVIFG